MLPIDKNMDIYNCQKCDIIMIDKIFIGIYCIKLCDFDLCMNILFYIGTFKLYWQAALHFLFQTIA